MLVISKSIFSFRFSPLFQNISNNFTMSENEVSERSRWPLCCKSLCTSMAIQFLWILCDVFQHFLNHVYMCLDWKDLLVLHIEKWYWFLHLKWYWNVNLKIILYRDIFLNSKVLMFSISHRGWGGGGLAQC